MLWWKAFDLTGISTLIISRESCPELDLETSECKVKPPHGFLVQQNFQSMISTDQFCISKFRHTIWLFRTERQTKPLKIQIQLTNKLWYPIRPPQNHYHLPNINTHFAILHYLTFVIAFNFSDNHYMVMVTAPSVPTVTGTCSSYLSVTNRRSLSKCTHQYKIKEVSKNQPLCQTESSNTGFHKVVWVY